MNLLVYEHASGGGFTNERIPLHMLSEGYGMLRTLISDFKAQGYNITTFLDSRLKTLNPPIEADNIISTSSRKELDENLKKLSGLVDAVYVIAPESGQVLQKLVKIVEACGGTCLNCQTDAIKEASNKMTICEVLEKSGLRVPETVTASRLENLSHVKRIVRELGFPVVFKPIDGVGCSGLSVVGDAGQITAAVNKIKRESPSKCFIVQKLIKRVSVSVSLISTGEKALPITLNKQMVTLAPPHLQSSYNGGIVPFTHSLKKEALNVAQMAVNSLKGLKGYVGVDMVLAKDEPIVIELNPRLTTSYIGLRNVVNFNQAQAIIDAVFRQKLPENVRSLGWVFFSKVKVPSPNPLILSKIYKLDGVVSPPFPLLDNEPAYALLASHSNRLKDSQTTFYRAKKHLLSILSER
ncbi:MAG: ATP-grasp domain-containing protein [Candidatus Bathycorpusculaceae bacterium]